MCFMCLLYLTCLLAFVSLSFFRYLLWFHFLCALGTFIFYVLYVPSIFHVIYLPSSSYVPMCYLLFTCLRCLHFFTCRTCSNFFTCLHFSACLIYIHFLCALHIYVSYVPSCFTRSHALRAFVLLLLTCLEFLHAFIFLGAYLPSSFYVLMFLHFFYMPYMPSSF